ncbi:hypothetical protein [Comamonas odontotermitis]|uniref:hypothetical protein n=1 Tax=Comamonas odontotermitis TaxID=379895 RepID=UPI001CC492E2|nr:hypothetical protein [Comamonas odontotermitis]UBB15474.1 hypothetical protein LAD35_11365 [Comamonas odontotermitis]
MADTITLAIDALASAAFIEGGVSIERTDEAREFTEQRKRELIEAIAVGQLQAVAAQAPAAVAVPEGWKLVPLEPTHDMLAQASMRLQQNTFPAESELEFQADAHTAWDAMLSVAPELPATEDSSAGDVVEVQAEPVAWRYKRRGDCFGDFWFKPAGKSADYLRIGREDGVVLAPCPDHFDWTPLYTAPQAQPADALDAKRYRLLTIKDVIEAEDEFLQDDCSWKKDEGRIWVGAGWTPLLRTVRRALVRTEATTDNAQAASQEGGTA